MSLFLAVVGVWLAVVTAIITALVVVAWVADKLLGTPAEQYADHRELYAPAAEDSPMRWIVDQPPITTPRGGIRYGEAPLPDGWPDPAKDDCPFWLPIDTLVPHKDRTPCRLDAGHEDGHAPVDPEAFTRAEHIAVVARQSGWTWDEATRQNDHGIPADTPIRRTEWGDDLYVGRP